MPIQRERHTGERHTGFPKVENSGVKGSSRQAFDQLKEAFITDITLNKEQNSKALSLSFGPGTAIYMPGHLALLMPGFFFYR